MEHHPSVQRRHEHRLLSLADRRSAVDGSEWLVMFQHAHWLVFVLSIAIFVLIMTNFIMNVAAIAISLPVSLVIAPYLGCCS